MVLFLANVPMQTLGQAVEPVINRIPEADGGDGVTRGSDANTAMTGGEKLDSL